MNNILEDAAIEYVKMEIEPREVYSEEDVIDSFGYDTLLDEMSINDIMSYLKYKYTIEDILYELDTEDIEDYLKNKTVNMNDEWEQVGNIGVDAGLCWVGDPCYVVSKDSSHVFETWEQFCDMLRNSSYYESNTLSVPYHAGHEGLGVVVTSGYGDGFYPVYVKKVKGTVTELKVVFS